MLKISDRELEILRMKQDLMGSLNELTRAANLVLEFIYQLKADLLRLHTLESALEDEGM